MSVNLTFTADNTEVVKKLGEIHEKMKSISWAEMTMGVDAVLNLLGKVKAGVIAVFDAVVAPAAEMEQLAAQFNTMLGFGFSAERSMAVLRRLGPCAPTQKSRKSFKLMAFSLLRSTRFELVTPSV